eukprot:COSAG05_NODE_49_length_24373_cov_16.162561_18_plen_75_part_00
MSSDNSPRTAYLSNACARTRSLALRDADDARISGVLGAVPLVVLLGRFEGSIVSSDPPRLTLVPGFALLRSVSI